ncbi:protein phosphatase regulator REG1 KNAG_0H01300 [Huiozyma naganishii CBS 8797]|uniref:Nitrogen regulatory protein areA GATA-like domain-containing protein n=1 Tax=Huiozyma naganishii (strain ATCC MYA-139 / BCRC 22969 / CBS 8797 / KCTC 17520 / NBRC 10181 / NCYC 3082 / Yp74L-3) TaxID=1071383 RepID=J7RPD6_HUIN7|nr:hypothetical protein KNAG_0H01300 [Kazachstania naganishii CBS 8797]CCK71543.1 hypothetical protein KNAG_0H01300 [Kazachstania naganishii CBS 8797]
MSSNLAEYFAKQRGNPDDDSGSNKMPVKRAPNESLPYGQDEDMGPSVSMAKQAKDDDDFNKSTFKLKRTRSMGLLDDYLDPTKKQTEAGGETVHGTALDSDPVEDMEMESTYQPTYHDDSLMTSASVSPPPADNDMLIPQDDTDVVREPQRHVDYLSHHWKESEISNSWKYIILKKKKRDVDLVNAARLENASWRTWAKARNNLRTVSPEVVNWSKDSDVTWLYGPIVRGNDGKKKHKQDDDQYTYDRGDGDMDDDDDDDDEDADYLMGYGSDNDENRQRVSTHRSETQHSHQEHTTRNDRDLKAPKPILKKRTVTEIIEENAQWKLNEARKHLNEIKNTVSITDPNGPSSVHDDYDLLAAKVNAQYYNYPKRNTSAQSDRVESPQPQRPQKQLVSGTQRVASPNEDTGGDTAVQVTPKNTDTNGMDQYTEKGRYQSSQGANENGTESTFGTIKKDTLGQNRTLSSILTSPSTVQLRKDKKKTRGSVDMDGVSTEKIRDRHIHFNDRVEQCRVVKYPDSEAGESDNYSDGYEDDEYFTDESHDQLSNYSGTDSETDSNSNDEDNDGLFINARFARRSDSVAHSPITDNSSVTSSLHGRQHHVRPIIKLLPATTLNYGSDEESDNSDYSANHGNAVSHNVNTQRGYDYIYDYNSVYTGDTSSFLPVDSCDIVDVPEGIDLQTAIADDNSKNYNLLSSQTSHKAVVNQTTDLDSRLCNSDDQYSLSSNTDDEQFIEDSNYRSSDEDNISINSSDEDSDPNDVEKNLTKVPSNMDADELALRRTLSVGKSNNSLRDLTKEGSTPSLSKLLTHSLISGKPFNKEEGEKASENISEESLKRSSGSRRGLTSNFIFNSDSEEEDEEAAEELNEDENLHGDLSLESLTLKTPKRKLGPPQRSSSSLLSTLAHSKSAGEDRRSSSDLNKSLGLPNSSSSAAAIAPNDIAINGVFPPRNDSLKSIASKEKLINANSEGSHSDRAFKNKT